MSLGELEAPLAYYATYVSRITLKGPFVRCLEADVRNGLGYSAGLTGCAKRDLCKYGFCIVSRINSLSNQR